MQHPAWASVIIHPKVATLGFTLTLDSHHRGKDNPFIMFFCNFTALCVFFITNILKMTYC